MRDLLVWPKVVGGRPRTIGLLRRIYLSDNASEELSKEEGRELLVFQIMHVISAPLIAVTTYYLSKLESITTSVLISFGSGFASETVLCGISALIARLNQAVELSSTPRIGQTTQNFPVSRRTDKFHTPSRG